MDVLQFPDGDFTVCQQF